MGSKRGVERIDALRARLYEGMYANGITPQVADEIYNKIEAFANFGFAESHSLSFAVLVYASSWLKLHYPAAFLAALLRAGADDEAIDAMLRASVAAKLPGHGIDDPGFLQPARGMNAIGG